ncbi:MAG: hypothetical protein P8184_21360, partial [Calditrichia bacterium]
RRIMTAKIMSWLLVAATILLIPSSTGFGKARELAKLTVTETAGIARQQEYIQVYLQNGLEPSPIIALNQETGDSVFCQVNRSSIPGDSSRVMLNIIFPVSLKAGERKHFTLMASSHREPPVTDLAVSGKGLELKIENKYYQADLTRSDQSEAKSHASGQLRELLIKMGFDRLLFRTENRMHWGPNFQKPGLEYYTTIAEWDNPAFYRVEKGPYRVRIERQDKAPSHPEILLTATYDFYAGKPYFIFFSEMEMTDDVWLELLRNDEMTMDSLFTNIAFQRPDGEIEDLPFDKRYDVLKKKPLENDAPWVCFYHASKGYAFGSIRLKYDNTNRFGDASPTWMPHTKISDGAGGGKYWNRRLIHEHLTFVPGGSRYVERNAYLVFRATGTDKFASIRETAKKLRHPLRVDVINE